MRPPTLSFITLAAVMAIWTTHTVHGQISVGCFQNQLDSSTGASDIKSYQDIYMSQGACTNYCRTSGTAYALTMDGSTCHCSNSAPMDSNKIDDAKCDKPCMGYPFEMCGGSSSRSIANVLLIGSSTAVPGGAGGGGSTSTSNGTGAVTTAPTASESSKKSQNGNSSNNSNGGGNGVSTTTTTTDNNGGKAFNTDTGMFPPPRPTTSPTHEHEPGVHDRDREGRLKKETGHLDASSDMDEDNSSGSGGGSSPGIIAASIAAIFGFAGLFAVAFVFSKRRRQRLSQAAWTENMLLPSSLIHTSANNDELEGHDYTRSSPIYHQHQHQNQHSNKQRESIPTPIPPPNMHFPPPLHPRQGGPLHMSQPSYPPPPPMMGIPGGGGGGHYHPMRGNPYQPFPLRAQRLSQQQQQYDPHLLAEQNLNHKEPVQASPPPPQLVPSFSRGPQTLQQGPPLPSGTIEHIRDNSEGGIEENYERHDERSLSHHLSVRSIRHDRQERGSVDSTANIFRVVNTDGSS